MLFEWIIYKALKDRQISRLHRFQVLFHSGITPVSQISSRNWYYITHQGKCYFSNYLAKYFFFTQTRPCMRVRKCEIPYLFRSTNCVGSLCLQQQRQCFISRSQYCNQKGREDSRASSLFFPLTPKARFRRRTFHEPNLIYLSLIHIWRCRRAI